MVRYFVFAAIGSVALFSAATADVSSGVVAYRQGDYAAAIREMLPLAEAGDSTAQYYVGAMYESGLGVDQSYDEALKWYRGAAEQGLVMAQYHLGVIYETGQGIAKNHAEAVGWYVRAAQQGYSPAQSNLGSLYLRGGWGLETNPSEALVWFSLAEDRNFPGAKERRMSTEGLLSRDEISDAEGLARERGRAIP